MKKDRDVSYNYKVNSFYGLPVLNWCVQNKFELVELDQTGDSESDIEGNKYGIDRIIEALHAHTWPNIVLKGCA